jgi:predicted AAA+ superfamily ATPase
VIGRSAKKAIQNRLQSFPAVALFGPRQSGKTTLAKSISSSYFDLESESEKLRLDLQWEGVVRSRRLTILDEAQNDPVVFSKMRSAIDSERKRNGRFLVLGSISPALMKSVSESLAGRIAVCELSPFSIREIPGKSIDQMWLMGGFPDGGILNTKRFPVWQRNYLDLLAMRDLPSWGLSAKPQMIKRFFSMLAVSHGTVWNASQLGQSLGISYHTVNSYLDYLEQAFLLRRLPPFNANLRKRLVRSPKIYWRDTGLLHSLQNIHTFDSLLRKPWVGLSWEGWVIEQICIHLKLLDPPIEGPFFFRTGDGHEIDLVLAIFEDLWGIEIKLSTSPDKNDLERLNKAADLIGADKRFIISRTLKTIEGKNVRSTNIKGFLDYLTDFCLNKSKIVRNFRR